MSYNSKYKGAEVEEALGLAKTALQEHQDLSHYATNESVDQKIAAIEIPEVDLSEYAKTGDIPTKVSELENDANYISDVIYSNGVYIQDVDGKLWTEEEWDGSATPNGIAVITDNHSLVMAIQDAHSDTCVWGGSNTTVSNIVTTTNSSTAATDYKGDANTTQIINQLSGTLAAKYCRDYKFPNGNVGYLGAAGEWQVVLDNKAAVTSALSKCGGTSLSCYYWTSTQYSSSRSWYMYWNNENLNDGTKSSYRYVRAFTALLTIQPIKDRISNLESDIPNKQDKIQVIDHGTDDTVFELTPNILHKWGTVTSLALTLATPEDDSVANYYMVEFTSGTTATTLSVPDTIAWSSDLSIEAGKTYQISILNNLGVIGGF